VWLLGMCIQSGRQYPPPPGALRCVMLETFPCISPGPPTMIILVTTSAMLGTLDSAATMPEARECPATATFDQSSVLPASR
jgi:hypothetical protein